MDETLDYHMLIFMGELNDISLMNQIRCSLDILFAECLISLDIGPTLVQMITDDIERFKELIFQIIVLNVLHKFPDIKVKLILEDLMTKNLMGCLLEQNMIEKNKFFEKVIAIKNESVQIQNQIKLGKMLLLMDEKLQGLPFEYLPTFESYSQCFYRIPCLQYLQQQFVHKLSIKNSFYVLNSQKDLSRSEQIFSPIFENQSTWQGIIGEEPSIDYMQENLQSKDFFIYIGHGAGEQFFPQKKITQMNYINSGLFLMGCSTLKQLNQQQIQRNQYELQGISLYYLIKNCPFIMGSLWNITDIDADNIFKQMLLNIISSKQNVDIVEQLRLSKKQDYSSIQFLFLQHVYDTPQNIDYIYQKEIV